MQGVLDCNGRVQYIIKKNYIHDKQIAGLIESRLMSLHNNEMPKKIGLFYISEQTPQEYFSISVQDYNLDAVIYVGKSKPININKTNFLLDSIIVFNVPSFEILIDSCKNHFFNLEKFMAQDVSSFDSSQTKELLDIELPKRHTHKTLILCSDWERKYFVDESQGSDFASAFTNRVIMDISSLTAEQTAEQIEEQVQSENNFKEIVSMRYPLNLLAFQKLDTTVKLSVFNTEQCTVPEILKKFIADLKTLSCKVCIYDYSLANIDIYGPLLNNNKFTFEHLPYQTTNAGQLALMHSKAQSKTYDFAHCGVLTEYRKTQIEAIRQKGYTVNIIQNKWALERDKEIVKCAALLNIHQTEHHKIYEACRCDRLLKAGISVYSEPSAEMPHVINLTTNILNKNLNKTTNCLKNEKQQFRELLLTYKKYINNFFISDEDLQNKSDLEAVLIEFRCFNHLEVLIKNAILKLGPLWSHTIICGNLNYEFIKNIANNISKKIKVIKLQYYDMTTSQYSTLLASKEFWQTLNGKKILIYQEDSFIFKPLSPELIQKWDYIGAPWPKTQNDTKGLVGNGGISLRSRSTMIEIIDKISINDTVFNQSTINYIKNTKSTVFPEDVYFALNMENFKIGNLADWESANEFSSETNYNPESLCGHNFWLSNKNWKTMIYKSLPVHKNNVPLNIFQTWKSKDLLGKNLLNSIKNIQESNPEFNYLFYNDNECETFIKENFEFSVYEAYTKLVPGAYKADLWRYCILYFYGGIYIDIKYECINNFKFIDLINEKRLFPHVLDRKMGWAKKQVGFYNGFMISKPKNMFLMKLINKVVENVRTKFYGLNCLHPTGPLLVAITFEEEETLPAIFDFYYSNNGMFIEYKQQKILKINETYRSEMTTYKDNHYGVLYQKKMIYK